MRKSLGIVGLAASLALTATAASAARGEAEADYARDAITVATPNLHSIYPTGKTATCVVWANAEGLGVGPAQLGGLHGIAMTINPKPLPDDSAQQPVSFASALASAKSQFPTAPAWLTRTLEKNQAAIEAGCAQDHETPFKVHTMTAKDKAG